MEVVFTGPANGTSGRATLIQKEHGVDLNLNVCVKGLRDGLHGFHIHERGDTEKGCDSMGGHFSKSHHDHGDLRGVGRHTGDLGNVLSVDGCVDEKLFIPGVSLYELKGRGLVLHEDEDDLGRGNSAASKSNGNSGKRIVCAKI